MKHNKQKMILEDFARPIVSTCGFSDGLLGTGANGIWLQLGDWQQQRRRQSEALKLSRLGLESIHLICDFLSATGAYYRL